MIYLYFTCVWQLTNLHILASINLESLYLHIIMLKFGSGIFYWIKVFIY